LVVCCCPRVGVFVIVCFRNCCCPVECVDLNVGILVGTSGVIFVLKPVCKNDVLAKVGSPVPAPVPVCTRLGKKEGLKVGMNVFAPAPVPAIVAVPLSTGKLEGKPVNFFVGTIEGNNVPTKGLIPVFVLVPVPIVGN